MADIDTSFYPKASQNNLLDTMSTVSGIKNAQETNKLLQLQQQQGQVQLEQSKVDQAHKMYEGFIGLLGSVAQDPRVGTAEGPQVIQTYATNAVKLGYITPEQAATALQTMPQDPAQIPQWLQTMNTQALAGQERFGQIYGTPGTIDNGSQTLPVAVSPITGVRPIAAPITKTLGPETRGDMMETVDSSGRKVLVPRANLLTQAGMDPMTAQPATAPQGAANQLIPAPAPVERQPLPPANPPGGVAVSPPAGQVEAQTRQAAASADQFSADQQREANYQADMVPLQKSLAGLQKLGDTGSGPGSEPWNDAKSFLVTQGVISPSDDVKVYDEVRKYTSQLARGSGDTGSDSRLAAAFSANPSVNISNAAAQDVVKSMISLRKLQNARVNAFQQTGQPASEYQKWATQWTKDQDPVAYGFDLMDGQQRLKFIKGLDAIGRAKFVKSLAEGVRQGVIAPPTAEQ